MAKRVKNPATDNNTKTKMNFCKNRLIRVSYCAIEYTIVLKPARDIKFIKSNSFCRLMQKNMKLCTLGIDRLCLVI